MARSFAQADWDRRLCWFAPAPCRRQAGPSRSMLRSICARLVLNWRNSVARQASRRNADTVVLGGERGTERLAARGEVRKHLGLVRRPSEYGFMAGIVAEEAEIIQAAPSVPARHLGNPSHSVLLSAPAAASPAAEISKAIITLAPLIE